MRVISAVLAFLAVATAAAASASLEVTVLPKPGFPLPARDVAPTGARLELVSSSYRDPATLPAPGPKAPAWAPKSFRGEALQQTIRQGSLRFLLYGRDASFTRYLVGADARTRELRYAFDFDAFTRPPNGGWLEPVTWARQARGVLYVSNSHLTYASATKRRNAYVSAIDLRTRKTLWRSPALVANARTFVLTRDHLVAGYGFTDEADFLYLLDRTTGKVLDRLQVPTAPEIVKLRGGLLRVRTYDRDAVVRLVER